VQLCVRWGIHPDAVSLSSIVAAAIAAFCFQQSGRWPVLLLIAPVFCYLRLWLNMLDGMVALASGKASRRGEILNDLPDRISDVLIFAGVAHSGLCHSALGYWAALMALLTAYVGVLSQAVGAGRQFGGLMSKPWRMVTLHLGAWIAWAVLIIRDGEGVIFNLTILDIALIIIIAGCLQTITVRLLRAFRTLQSLSNQG
jgi:phosphatidylglycerophosphate synthase